jgi:hypothetical protein
MSCKAFISDIHCSVDTFESLATIDVQVMYGKITKAPIIQIHPITKIICKAIDKADILLEVKKKLFLESKNAFNAYDGRRTVEYY